MQAALRLRHGFAAAAPRLRTTLRFHSVMDTTPHVMIGGGRVDLPVAVKNIYCIGRNFADHARELGNAVPTEEPVVFLKSSAALRGLQPREALAFADEAFHHEIELVLLVGKHVPLGALPEGREYECVQAVGLGLDLTRRGKQNELKKEGKPWTLAKSFAGSAIVSPMRPADGSFELDEISFELAVNGNVRQSGHVNQMIFDMPFQLRYLNSLGPLLAGDLIFTGTPAGVAELRQGDEVVLRYLSPPSLVEQAKQYRGVL